MATLNVRGMKMVERRAAVYLSVRDLYYDVLFLQECHLENDKDVEFFFKRMDFGTIFLGSGECEGRWGGDSFFFLGR